MKLALVGGTCVGKTSVMKRLAEISSIVTRSCGGEVMRIAQTLGVDPENLRESDHRNIDDATIAFCIQNEQSFIVDGRYLHYVLAGKIENISIIELVAKDEIRLKRSAARSRNNGAAGVAVIEISDSRDIKFCADMYAEIIPSKPHLVIDTSNYSIEEVGNQIIAYFLKFNPPFSS